VTKGQNHIKLSPKVVFANFEIQESYIWSFCMIARSPIFYFVRIGDGVSKISHRICHITGGIKNMMPALKKLKFLKNLNVPWGPRGNKKKESQTKKGKRRM
jgi:hypothetical protein